MKIATIGEVPCIYPARNPNTCPGKAPPAAGLQAPAQDEALRRGRVITETLDNPWASARRRLRHPKVCLPQGLPLPRRRTRTGASNARPRGQRWGPGRQRGRGSRDQHPSGASHAPRAAFAHRAPAWVVKPRAHKGLGGSQAPVSSPVRWGESPGFWPSSRIASRPFLQGLHRAKPALRNWGPHRTPARVTARPGPDAAVMIY